MNSASINRDSLAEAVNLISGTTVSAALYTLALIFYYLSTRLSYLQLRNSDGKAKQTIVTLALASLLMICATMDVTLSNIERRLTYVDYGTLPGGPLGLPAGLHATTVTRVRLLVLLVDNLLILGALVWRVLVLWSGTPFVKPVTLSLYVAYLGLATTNYVSQYQISGQLTSSLAVPRIADSIFISTVTFGTSYIIVMNLMLIIRLLSIRWQHIQVMGKSETADQYLSIAAVLIESYVLETAWNIAFCIFCALKLVPVDNIFDATIIQVDVLTNLLVIYRVVSGRAYDGHANDQLSSLRWNRTAISGAGTADP